MQAATWVAGGLSECIHGYGWAIGWDCGNVRGAAGAAKAMAQYARARRGESMKENRWKDPYAYWYHLRIMCEFDICFDWKEI